MGPISLNANTQPLQPLDPTLLLHPMIPSGAFGLNPRTALGQEWWDIVRRNAVAMNNHCCYACGIHKSDTREGWLDGHETYEYDHETRKMRYVRTVSICTMCHSFVHMGRQIALLENKEISGDEYVQVILHGYKVLRNAGLWPTAEQVVAIAHGGIRLNGAPEKMIEDLVTSLPIELVTEARTLSHKDHDERSWTLVIDSREFKSSVFGKVKEVK